MVKSIPLLSFLSIWDIGRKIAGGVFVSEMEEKHLAPLARRVTLCVSAFLCVIFIRVRLDSAEQLESIGCVLSTAILAAHAFRD